MSTIIIDTVVTTTNVLTTGIQGPVGPRGPAGDPALIEQLQTQISVLASTKLDAADYVQHFRGLFTSYINLSTEVPVGINGDYAHIKENDVFGVMEAIWDSADEKWVISAVNVGSNTDAVAEGSTNLYFTSERVRQTTLNSVDTSDVSPILSTDNLIAALCKLQAQTDTNKWNWVSVHDVGVINTAIIKEEFIDDKGGIQFCIKDNYLYMRALFSFVATANSATKLIEITNPTYRPLFTQANVRLSTQRVDIEASNYSIGFMYQTLITNPCSLHFSTNVPAFGLGKIINVPMMPVGFVN